MRGEKIYTWSMVVRLIKWNNVYKMNEIDYLNQNGEGL